MIDRTMFSVAWYRFRATIGRRWGGYLALIVLVGAVGGLAMGSIAAGRRTQSSYPTFLASTNPSDLNVAVYNPATNGGPGPNLATTLSRLPGVKRVRTVVAPQIVPLARNGAPRLNTLNLVSTLGSLDGEFYAQDRLATTSGRLADPARADEIMMTASAARLLGIHLGEVVPLGMYVPSQMGLPGFGTAKVPPVLRVRAKLVGIVTLNNQVVQDDIDQAYGFTIVTPALLRQVVAKSPEEGSPEGYGLQLLPRQSVTAVEQEVVKAIPQQLTYEFHVTSRVVTEVELANKPESVALGAFGAIAGLVALVLGTQAVARQLRWDNEGRRVLRALGASPIAAAGDGLIGVVVAVLLGAALALIVAVALSPLAPLGPVRPVYPKGGIAFDWTVLGIGVTVLFVGLALAAAAISYRSAPSRDSRLQAAPIRRSSVTRVTETAGVPVAGAVGVRFALQKGRGSSSVPVRSALLGTVLAVALLVGTLTFASGLHTLVSSPALYGWNWSYMLNPSNSVPPAALKLLDDDRDISAWSGIAAYTSAELDGQTVPFLISYPRATVAPPILSGHGLEGNDQVVLGNETLAVLNKHVGDTVTLSIGSPKSAPVYVPPTRLRIVGSATFPAVGYSSFVADHTSMGIGALISTAALPATFLKAASNKDPTLNGPQLVFVRLRPGVSAAAGLASLEHIAAVANKILAADPNAAGNNVTVLGVQRPVQIVNYRTIGSTPVLLAAGLALGAIIALALTLLASVRHRRRDLALLKALGFRPRQLAAVVAWQSSVTVLIGVIVGLPLGIIIGRQLWTLFARNINAVPDPTVPALAVTIVGIGALVFANVIAALPGQFAARTPTALVLRAE